MLLKDTNQNIINHLRFDENKLGEITSPTCEAVNGPPKVTKQKATQPSKSTKKNKNKNKNKNKKKKKKKTS